MDFNDTRFGNLANLLGADAAEHLRDVADGQAKAWSVFDPDGAVLDSEGASETATAVCSNLLDLASLIGVDLGEDPSTPKLHFKKGGTEMRILPCETANLMVLQDTATERKD